MNGWLLEWYLFCLFLVNSRTVEPFQMWRHNLWTGRQDKKIVMLWFRGGGGGCTLCSYWVGVCRWHCETLTLFKRVIRKIWYPVQEYSFGLGTLIKTEPQISVGWKLREQIPCSRHKHANCVPFKTLSSGTSLYSKYRDAMKSILMLRVTPLFCPPVQLHSHQLGVYSVQPFTYNLP